jgi:hypothetical protein
MADSSNRVVLRVRPEGDDPADLEEFALALRRELRDLEVEEVELTRLGSAPPGAKSVKGLIAGLLVTLDRSRLVLGQVVAAISAGWAGTAPAASARILTATRSR